MEKKIELVTVERNENGCIEKGYIGPNVGEEWTWIICPDGEGELYHGDKKATPEEWELFRKYKVEGEADTTKKDVDSLLERMLKEIKGITIFRTEDLDEELWEMLWNLNVNLDDADYVVFIPADWETPDFLGESGVFAPAGVKRYPFAGKYDILVAYHG